MARRDTQSEQVEDQTENTEGAENGEDTTNTDGTRNRKIAEFVVRVPNKYAEGHVVTSNEAAALNQIVAENFSNNLRDKLKRGFELKAPVAKNGDTPAQPGEYRPYTLEEAQAIVDEYASRYQMGVRQGGGGGGQQITDPVEKEARKLAENAVKALLAERGIKQKDVEDYKGLVNSAFEKRRDEYMVAAAPIVEARKLANAGVTLGGAEGASLLDAL